MATKKKESKNLTEQEIKANCEPAEPAVTAVPEDKTSVNRELTARELLERAKSMIEGSTSHNLHVARVSIDEALLFLSKEGM